MPELLDPKVDIAFKRIFGSERYKGILLSFLQAVLNWQGDHRIVDAEILNPYLEQEFLDDSLGILDVKVRLANRELVDVEMQVANLGNMERLVNKLIEEDASIRQAKDALEEMAANPKAKEIYELRRKAILDLNSGLYDAEQRGEQKGKAEGKLESAIDIARVAIKEGADLNFIVKITGLSLEKLEELQAEMEN